MMTEEEYFSRHEKNGYPAFPCSLMTPSGATMISGGMTLRDWFAGHAMTGLLASPIDPLFENIEKHAEHFSGLSYLYADAMLKARAATEETSNV